MREVLRMKSGERCLLIDGAGREAVACLKSYDVDGRAELEIETVTADTGERFPLILNLYPAVPQRGKMDVMIEKAQEWILYNN